MFIKNENIIGYYLDGKRFCLEHEPEEIQKMRGNNTIKAENFLIRENVEREEDEKDIIFLCEKCEQRIS